MADTPFSTAVLACLCELHYYCRDRVCPVIVVGNIFDFVAFEIQEDAP